MLPSEIFLDRFLNFTEVFINFHLAHTEIPVMLSFEAR